MPAKEKMSDNDLPDPSWSEAKKAAWDAQKKMDEDMNLAKNMTARPGGGQEKKKNEERRRTKEVIAADEAAKREEAYSPSDKTANALLARERVRTFDQLTPTVPEHYDVLGLKPHHEIARLRMKGLNGSDGERLAALVMHQYLDLPDRESALRVIDLSWNSVGLTGATALARSLSPRFDPHRKKLIMSLDLSQNSIGTAGAVELAELLKGYDGLKLLRLGWNKIGHEGATALAESLQANSTLETLDVRQNWLSDEGCYGFGEVHFGSLTHLDLRDNHIGTAGCHALAKGFKRNSTLTSLNLHSNVMGQEGLWALGDALVTRRRLFFKKERTRLAKYKGMSETEKRKEAEKEMKVEAAVAEGKEPDRELTADEKRQKAKDRLAARRAAREKGEELEREVRPDEAQFGDFFKRKKYEYHVYFHGVPVEACPIHRQLFGHHIASNLDSKFAGAQALEAVDMVVVRSKSCTVS